MFVTVGMKFFFISGFVNIRGSVFVVLNEGFASCFSGHVPDACRYWNTEKVWDQLECI
jgi:hypothetical protein